MNLGGGTFCDWSATSLPFGPAGWFSYWRYLRLLSGRSFSRKLRDIPDYPIKVFHPRLQIILPLLSLFFCIPVSPEMVCVHYSTSSSKCPLLRLLLAAVLLCTMWKGRWGRTISISFMKKRRDWACYLKWQVKTLLCSSRSNGQFLQRYIAGSLFPRES